MSFRQVGWGMVAAAIISIANLSNSYGAIIASWTYETATPSDLANSAIAPTVFADVGTGTGTAVHALATTDWSTPSGNGSANSLSGNEWTIGDYFQFEVSTVGFEDITLSWDHTSSTTGPGIFDLEYRVGNAGAFTTALDDYIVLPNSASLPGIGTWNATTAIPGYSYTLDLSSISALDNQPVVQFRITMAANTDAAPPGTVAPTGTSRVDNFTVNGTPPIPEPSTIALGAIASLGFLGYRLRRKQS